MSLKLVGQGVCFTDQNIPDVIGNRTNLVEPRGNYTVRLFFHFLRHTSMPNGGGISSGEFTAMLDKLKDNFEPLNICFTVIGTDDIYDNNLFYQNFGNNNPLFTMNRHNNAIDIYIGPKENWSQGGRAAGIPSGAFWIGGSFHYLAFQYTPPQQPVYIQVPFYMSNVVSHEMGHCLGLYHTHHEFEIGGCSECLDETNCSLCGDYVCDTKPDPYIQGHVDRFDCNWDGIVYPDVNATDSCGYAWDPDEQNIMSYTNEMCSNYFTAGQGERIRGIIANSQISNYVIPDNLMIQNLASIGGYKFYSTPVSITAGYNVNPNLPSGNVQIFGASATNFISGSKIELLPGFTAVPWSSGYFSAKIDLDFCDIHELNSARLSKVSSYSPLLEENKKWLATSQHFEGNISLWYEFLADTNISGRIYKTIVGRVVQPPGIGFNPFLPLGTIYDKINLREDVANKKLFYYDHLHQVDSLLFDFNLSLGDTIFIPFPLILNKIDSVQTSEGYRKHFQFGDSIFRIDWIEGLGNLVDPFSKSRSISTSPFDGIVCVYKNNTILFSNPSFSNSCQFFNVEDPSWIKHKYSIYPNPSNGEFIISSKSSERFNIKLANTIGNEVLKKLDCFEKEIIDLKGFANGLYILQITDILGRNHFEKIVLK